MNSAIRHLALLLLAISVSTAKADMRETVLREAAIRNGLLEPEKMVREIDPNLSAVGKQLFESSLLSLNSDMSCKTCHLDKFSSADGLPNAVGVGGTGEGLIRLKSGGKIVPRNTLPLWGRGSMGFSKFFWDGKVEIADNQVISQFGDQNPSTDPLVVSVHLPFVEIREMLVDDDQGNGMFATESVGSANNIYQVLAGRIRSDEKLGPQLANAAKTTIDSIDFGHIADAVAEHIREHFQIRNTRFHKFVFESEQLSSEEIAGGLLFYGKGRCALCHTGPMFTDFEFHAIPIPQIGFGKNGFGLDFGRYNVTFDPEDAYRFRTPPLFNVEFTSPYGHAGSVSKLADVVRYHVDPLWNTETHRDLEQRQQLYGQIRAWAAADIDFQLLSPTEIESLVLFLQTLSFEQNTKSN